MFYTLTLNPSLDYVMNAENFAAGKINRSSSESFSAGGKGINVSKVLESLGEKTVATGFCAGFSGRQIEAELDSLGIENDFVHLENGNSRVNVKIPACRGTAETAVNGAGPDVGPEYIEILMKLLDRRLSSGDFLVLSGNVVKDGSPDLYRKIMEAFGSRGVRFVLDASGPALRYGLDTDPAVPGAVPFVVKPNGDELGELCGKIPESAEEAAAEAGKLVDAGRAKNVFVSLGEKGAVLVNRDGVFFSCVPSPSSELGAERSVSTVGAGDSSLAGFLYGCTRGWNWQKSLDFAMAAGAATVYSGRLATKETIAPLCDCL